MHTFLGRDLKDDATIRKARLGWLRLS